MDNMHIKDLHKAIIKGGWDLNNFKSEILNVILDKINTLNWSIGFDDTYKFLYVLENFIEANYLKHYKGDLKGATL